MTKLRSGIRIKAQLMCGDDIALGPGKAALLQAIADTGSISAAGRAMGLSYRRAWLLVDTMNRCYSKPLVETAHGGPRGGGAKLTSNGGEMLRDYRLFSAALEEVAQRHYPILAAGLRKQAKPKTI